MQAPGGLRSRVDWAALLLAAAVAVTAISVALRIASFTHDSDEGIYWQSLLSLDAGNQIFTEVFSSQGPLFLLSMLPIFHVFGPSVAAGRATILIFAVVGVVATLLLGRRTGRSAGMLAAALVLTEAPIMTMSVRLASTVPSVAMSTVGVWLAGVAPRRAGRGRLWVAGGAGLVFAAATAIKPLAVVALPAALCLLVWPELGGTAGDGERSASLLSRERISGALPRVAALVGGFVIGIGVIAAVLWSDGALYDQVVDYHLSSRDQRSGLFFNLKIVTSATLRTPLLLAAVVAVVIVVWRRLSAAYVWVVWLATASVFLLLQHPLFAQHVLVLVPPSALIVGCLPSLLRRSGSRVSGWVDVGVALVVVAGIVTVVAELRDVRQDPNRQHANEIAALRSHVSPDQLVVTDDQYIAAAADRRVPAPLVDTSTVRFLSEHLDDEQLIEVTDQQAAAVFFSPRGRFARAPDFRSWVEENFRRVERFEDDGALYVRRRR